MVGHESGVPAVVNLKCLVSHSAMRKLAMTGSMHNFGEACKRVLPEILALVTILGAGRARLRFLSYGDYDTPQNVITAAVSGAAAHDALAALDIDGGGDFPEAVKTALHTLLCEIEAEGGSGSSDSESGSASTPRSACVGDAEGSSAGSRRGSHVLFLFTDAPPHTSDDGPLASSPRHIAAERAALGDDFSWQRLCTRAAAANVATVTFMPEHSLHACALIYSLLGPLVALPQIDAAEISAAVAAVFLHMMGEEAEEVRLQRCPETEPPLELRRWQKSFRAMTRDVLLPEPTLVEYATERLAQDACQVRGVLGGTLARLPALLKTDAALRAEAVEQLLTLATPERVRTLMVNAALGKVWRAVAAFRRHDERVHELCNRFGAAVQGDAEMQAWVESTYMMQEEIDEILNACEPGADRLVADGAAARSAAFPPPSRRATLDLLRGSITADAAGGVLEFLRSTSIRSCAVEPVTERGARAAQPPASEVPPATPPASGADATPGDRSWAPEDGVPVTLPDAQFFAVLLHLLHPGTLASKRSAALIAVYAVVSGSVALAARAERWLGSEAMRGCWTGADDPDTYPEVFSVQFMHVVRSVRQLLTDAEASFFERLWYLWRFRRTQLAAVRVRVCAGVHGGKTEVRPDHRKECRKCRHARPMSLMLRGGCVFCADTGAGDPDLPSCAAEGQQQSHIVQCRVKSCGAFYAVEHPELLRCSPKCHYCREKEPAPTITCVRCAARHICPDVHRMHAKVVRTWVCAPCEAAAAAGEDSSAVVVDAPLGELMHENPGLASTLEFSVPMAAINGRLSAAFREHEGAIAAQEPEASVAGLTWHGAAVLNCAAVAQQTRDVVRSADVNALCPLCCCSRPLEAMASACGACDVEICQDCIRRWYALAPGTLPVSPAQLHCPFCKRAPARRAQLCGRRNLPLQIRLEEGMVLGFCRMCRVIKGAVARECVRDVPERDNWACIECEERAAAAAAAAAAEEAQQAAEDAAVAQAAHEEEQRIAHGETDELRQARRVQAAEARRAPRVQSVKALKREGVTLLPGMKECPGCGYGTIRASGCWHITCVVCCAHWCWRCGGEFQADEIYDHLQAVHGGIGI